MPVLIVSPLAATHEALQPVLESLHLPYRSTGSVRGFRRFFHLQRFPLIVCESHLPDGEWWDVLEGLDGGRQAHLVVTARTADERLWSEVLHRGGYDVLAQPFDAAEARRVMAIAWASSVRNLMSVVQPVQGPHQQPDQQKSGGEQRVDGRFENSQPVAGHVTPPILQPDSTRGV
jgi:DNA-binding NtrC family response regulator